MYGGLLSHRATPKSSSISRWDFPTKNPPAIGIPQVVEFPSYVDIGDHHTMSVLWGRFHLHPLVRKIDAMAERSMQVYGLAMLGIHNLPSGKHTKKTMEHHNFLMGKSTISVAIFNSKL